MKTLITGASGYVGSAIAARLAGLGWEIVGLDCRPPNAQCACVHVQANIGSTLEWETLADRIPPCECIVHAAAAIEYGLHDNAIALVNCFGTQQLLKLANERRIEKFVFFSSVPVIGRPRQIPVTEEHPVDPPTAYHASKLFGECLLRISNRLGDMKAATFRLTSPVGPGAAPKRIFSTFVDRAMAGKPIQLDGRGSRRQNYVDVRDVALAVELCLKSNKAGLFNIAGASSISNLELAETCKRVLNSSSPIEFSGKPDPEEGVDWEISIEKARRIFGYKPAIAIEQSVGDYAAGKRP